MGFFTIFAAKEAHELEYWLALCKQSKNYPCFSSTLTDTLQEVINAYLNHVVI